MIRVLIERHIAKTLENAYEERSRKILQEAVAAPGFVSGETLVDAHDPNHRITLANWQSETDWNRWYTSADRKALLLEVAPMMDKDEKITILKQC
ncbi:MAG: antibiotic biosynthesis monooxygenase [Pseudohongiellaceae bacterium]